MCGSNVSLKKFKIIMNARELHNRVYYGIFELQELSQSSGVSRAKFLNGHSSCRRQATGHSSRRQLSKWPVRVTGPINQMTFARVSGQSTNNKSGIRRIGLRHFRALCPDTLNFVDAYWSGLTGRANSWSNLLRLQKKKTR